MNGPTLTHQLVNRPTLTLRFSQKELIDTDIQINDSNNKLDQINELTRT
jgi:hypothetical protein